MDSDFLARAETMFLNAATDPALWRTALDVLTQQSGSRGAALLTVEGRGPFVLPTEAMGEVAERYVRESWHQRDFRYAGIPRMKRTGIFVDQDIVDADAMGRIAYYADYLRPMGFGWFAGLKVDTGDDLWCLTLQRGMAGGPYQRDEQRNLVRLGQIVSRAATLARQIEFTRLEGAVDMAGTFADACLFIDRHGRAVKLNAKAEAMLGTRFQLRDGRIWFRHCSSAALQRHIEATIWPELGPDDAAHLPVPVPQPSGRPLIFQAIRLRGHTVDAFAPARVLLVVKDLNEKMLPKVEHLQAVFQLTLSEARLANALLREVNLVEAARHLDCSYETARSQIKTVFAKTGTCTQAELVGLLARLRDTLPR